jgi:hypothetical protein
MKKRVKMKVVIIMNDYYYYFEIKNVLQWWFTS